MKVANPIYDIVFKYLMEDERIARTILSALLKKEVTHVEQRRNEYVKGSLKGLTLSRIDFGATVREDNGEEKLILVEMQKAWVDTETERFRKYLAEQYGDQENMMKGPRNEYAIPMVAVYLLGHTVGDIEEPVLYVRQQAYDYRDRPVTKGLPDPFVDSLTHGSIIVQIPRLRGLVNNKLFKVLSIFDQSHIERRNKQIIDIDEADYEDDDYMQPIFRRLLEAVSDKEVRKEMSIEDEIGALLQKHETEILAMGDKLRKASMDIKQMTTDMQQMTTDMQQMTTDMQQMTTDMQQKESELKQMTTDMQQKDSELQQKDSELQQKDSELQQKDSELQQKDSELQQKDSELQQKDGELQQKDSELQQKDSELQQKDSLLRKSVLALKTTMSAEQIAATLGITADEVERLSKNSL